MDTPTIIVTGANGQLGQEFRKISEQFNYNFIFADRKKVDFSNLESVKEYFSGQHFDIIINCAAYTAVDKAETDQAFATTVNSDALAIIAELVSDKGAFLIHFSTDYVFDGKGYQPYSTEHPTKPVNHYGESKCAGEKAMQTTKGLNGMIVRTSWVYSEYGHNFVKTMVRLGREREELNVINDQIGSPTYAADIAKFILSNLQQMSWSGVKIYNFSNEGVCSWYDFAQAIMELKNIPCKINPIPSSQYPTPAKRPHYSVLDKSQTVADFGVKIPYWRDSLKVCLSKI